MFLKAQRADMSGAVVDDYNMAPVAGDRRRELTGVSPDIFDWRGWLAGRTVLPQQVIGEGVIAFGVAFFPEFDPNVKQARLDMVVKHTDGQLVRLHPESGGGEAQPLFLRPDGAWLTIHGQSPARISMTEAIARAKGMGKGKGGGKGGRPGVHPGAAEGGGAVVPPLQVEPHGVAEVGGPRPPAGQLAVVVQAGPLLQSPPGLPTMVVPPGPPPLPRSGVQPLPPPPPPARATPAAATTTPPTAPTAAAAAGRGLVGTAAVLQDLANSVQRPSASSASSCGVSAPATVCESFYSSKELWQ